MQGSAFIDRPLAQLLATIQVFPCQNKLNCTGRVHLSLEVETSLLLVYSFSTHTPQQTELGLDLNSWGMAFQKDPVPI